MIQDTIVFLLIALAAGNVGFHLAKMLRTRHASAGACGSCGSCGLKHDMIRKT